MSPEKQKIAISEACGWKPGPHGYDSVCLWGVPPKPRHASLPWEELPDYLSDLNAMHEAEKVLTRFQAEYFFNKILPLTLRLSGEKKIVQDQYTAHATAVQRAEAFLRTIGKWEDSE